MIKVFNILIYLFSYHTICVSNDLRTRLFDEYNSNIRPVKNISDSVNLRFGMEIKGLEYFDQKAENIKFNLWITQTWKDEFMTWNTTKYPEDYITTYNYKVWIPDLELYNAASKPKIYDNSDKLKIFSNGKVLWIRPTTYSFSCPLDFHDFPFDKQSCTMTFGSWKYNADYLNLRPFLNDTKYTNISVDSKFSHNEWYITNTYVIHEEYEYLCCPGELWPNSMFTIVLKRNYVKYMVVIAMTLLITMSALTLLLFQPTDYKRTFVLVFIPLSIIWLQIYISSKIPVIEYYTLLDKILLTCFLTTILCAFESSILFCILNEKIGFLKKIYGMSHILGMKNKDYTVIVSDPLKNMDIYKKLYNHIIIFDKIFIVCINAGFFISILILLI